MAALVYGRNPVLEALQAEENVDQILLAEGVRRKGPIAEILALAEEQGVPVRWRPRSELDDVAHSHQGVVAQVEPYQYATVDQILGLADERGERPFLLLLDCVQDVHNLGSLLRTAEAVGVHGVVIPKRRAAGVTAAVRKASAGAVEHVMVARVTNLVRTMEALKGARVWFVGLEVGPEAQDYREADLDMALGLVVGSEGTGMRRLVRETCDFLIRLPMQGELKSLNAAVAGSIVLYEAWRQRSAKRAKPKV